MRVLSTPLGGKPLTLAALGGTAPSHWYMRRPEGPDDWRNRAASVRAELLENDWLPVLRDALAPSGLAAERLEAAAAGAGFVVTTGQQPGLFGGPLYTWWKAISALSLADHLSTLTGLPTAPVFWAATDDTDFAEAASTVVATADGAWRIELPTEAHEAKLSMAAFPLPGVAEQIEILAAAAGSSSHSNILDVVGSSYARGNTVGSAYVSLLRAVLEPLGIAVLDAAHARVRAAAAPLLTRAIEHADEIQQALLARDSELEREGFSPQVQTVRGRTLVFAVGDGRRERIVSTGRRSPAVVLKGPELSPNVLLRPLAEKAILPTVAYIGGPAEIAYFAQVSAVAGALDRAAPLILPRWSGILIEPRIARILERYGLEPGDFRDPHAVETRIARDSLPSPLMARLVEVRETLGAALDRLAQEPGSDVVPSSVPDGLRRNVAHRLDRLERRYLAAVKRRGNEALRDIATARGALYPLGIPQERALNIVPLLARYGEALLQDVRREVDAFTARLL